MNLPEEARDELARIVETVAHDGLEGPRDLDVALDAIIFTVYDHDLGVPPNADFNYVIGHDAAAHGGVPHLVCYGYGGTQVFFGDKRDAVGMLSYVRSKEPRKGWRIVPVLMR